MSSKKSHTLPILMPAAGGQRFSCHSCTDCCRSLVVYLTEEDCNRLRAQNWTGRINGPPYVRMGKAMVLNQNEHGCVFLREDGKCRIHAEYGMRAKPISCQIYPFALTPLQGAWRMSLRYDCPSIAKSQGLPLAEHREDLDGIARQLPQAVANHVIMLQPGRIASETECLAVTSAFDNWLANEDVTLRSRIAGMVNVIDTLAEAKLGDIKDDRFVELLDILFDGISAGGPQHNRQPTARQDKMLRQLLFAHCERINFQQGIASLYARFRSMLGQYRRNHLFSAGRGHIPLSFGSGPAFFEDIANVQPASPDDGDINELVTRYLRVQLSTRSVFGDGYYGWNIVDGLSALVLRVAVWGWLARYFALALNQQTVSFDAAVSALRIIAQAPGISRALGRRTERMRLAYLRLDSGISRLTNQYALL